MTVRNGPPLGPLSLNEHTRSAVEADCDFAALERFLASRADLLRLPLDAGRSVDVEVVRVLARGPLTRTLVGRVAGDPFSDVLLVFHDGAVGGSVAFLDRNEHYEFGSAGNGRTAIRRLDPATYPAPCGDPGEHHACACEPATAADEPAGGEPDPPTPAPDNTGAPPAVLIDTVVGYDPAARAADGGVAGIEARIIASVDRMNAALSNSFVGGVAVALRATVEDSAYLFPGEVAGDMGNADELGHLDDDSDGVLDIVSDLRRELGADHQAFIVKQPDGYAGIAYRPGRSMIVARDYMTSTRITFGHEFGHNLGARHAWGDTAADLGVNHHSYGWRLDPPGAAPPVRTIMAYDWGWGESARIPHYSNPAVYYNGANTGAPDGYDATADPTADPRCVSGGLIGGTARGYDGSNPALGARVADVIAASAPALAAAATRPAPEISVEYPPGAALTDGTALVALRSPAPGTTTGETFTIRNTGTAPLGGLAVSLDGPAAADFAVSGPLAASVAAGASTTFEVQFTPSAYGERSANLRVASDDADENPFDIALRGQAIGRWEFTQTQPIIIPEQGNANPYPSMVQVSGVSGQVLSVRVILTDLSHGYPDDLDLFLVAPSGQVCALMSDAGGGANLLDVDLVFDDAAASPLADWLADWQPITPGSYRPTNYGQNEPVPPGGVGSPGTSLLGVAGANPNGTWKLFASDDAAGDGGRIGGWSLVIQAAGTAQPAVSFASAGQTAAEDGGPVLVQVALSEPATVDVTVPLTLAGTAGSPADFTLAPNPLVIPAGQTAAVTVVTPVDDLLDEPAETILLAIGQPQNASVGATPAHTLTLTDNDEVLVVTSTHGGPVPPAGETVFPSGTEVTARVTSPDVSGATRHVCTGWTGTGSVPAGGAGSELTFTISRNSSLHWSWATEFRLELAVVGEGALDAPSGWHPKGSEVTVRALPAIGRRFAGWTGDTAAIIAGGPATAQITVRVDDPLDLTATFEPLPAPELAVAGPTGALLVSGGGTDFGRRVTGTGTVLRTFTLRNVGEAPLDGIAVGHDGSHAADFQLDGSATAATLAPGAATSFVVGFAPAASGPRTAVVHIVSNDPARNPFDIVLTGTGATALEVYQEWAAAAGLTGDAAAPDAVPFGDGISNLLKYAFGMDGGAADRRPLVPGSGLAGLPVLWLGPHDGVPACHYEFVRRRDAGLVYSPRQSSMLTPPDWSPAAGTTTVTAIDVDWERVVVTRLLDGAPPSGFFTVEVALP